jgi:hypothetical protein
VARLTVDAGGIAVGHLGEHVLQAVAELVEERLDLQSPHISTPHNQAQSPVFNSHPMTNFVDYTEDARLTKVLCLDNGFRWWGTSRKVMREGVSPTGGLPLHVR